MNTIAYLKLFLALTWGALGVQAQTGAFQWTWRNPLPHGEYLNSAVWTGNQIVAVGMVNSVRTSPDARAWTQRDLEYRELWGTTLNGITWTGTRLVGVGEFGRITSSSDGITWIEEDSPVAFLDFRAVCWSGSLLVAVGDDGTIATSPDGTTWKEVESGTSENLNAVIWAGSRFVAAGDAGIVLVSTDGAAWTAATSGTTDKLLSVAWTGGTMVVGGDGLTLTSSNGTSWTAHEQINFSLKSLIWTGNRLVGVGYPIGVVWTSANGEEWAETDLEPEHPSLTCVVKTGNEILVFGENGHAFASHDGNAWTRIGSGTTENLNAVVWSGSLFLAVGDRGTTLTSPDGVNWTHRSTPSDRQLNGAVWTGSQFVAVGHEGTVLTSPNGSVWSQRDPGTDHDLSAVAWTGTQLVAVGNRGRDFSIPSPANLWTSPDGITWTPRTSGKDADLYDVTWTGSQLVAVGGLDVTFKAVILTSPDGIAWTGRTLTNDPRLYTVVHGNGQILALGDGSHHLISADGITWADTSLGMASDAAVWTGTGWVTASDAVAYYTTPDLRNWTKQTSRVGANIQSLAWNGTLLVAVGFGGSIVTGTRAQISTRKSTQPGSIDLRLTPRHIEVTFPQSAHGSAGFGGRSAKVRLVSLNGAVSREPETVSASRIRFSALGLPAGVYFVKWESAGRTGARAFAIAP